MTRYRTNPMILFAAIFLLAGAGNIRAAQQKEVPVATARNDAPTPEDPKPAPVAATTDPAYVIGPQDVLDISIWKEPDVSRTVPVRPDGRISLPLINDVQAAGLSPQQLAKNVTEKLRKYLNAPQVTVIVTAINSQRVFVVGEVMRAGAFPLIPGMTVMQALSSAGGFTTFADMKKIHIMRMHDGATTQLPFNYREVLKGDNPEQNIKLEPGDTVVVP
ncbi:MAG: polysaccharide biosynthesis/export family protein [Candidatus Acidiferrales bacterium]